MKFARLISGMFHPMLMPLFGLFIIFHSGSFLDMTPLGIKRMIYLIVLVSTVLLPLSILPLLKMQKIITGFGMPTHRERVLPLLFSAIFYYFGYFLLKRLPISSVIQDFQLAAIIAILMVMLVSMKWKISLHMTGIGGLLGLIIAMTILYSASLRIVFVLAILAAGILGTARLRLNVHTPAQVYSGLGLGFVTILLTVLLS
ncbi:MAG: PAP2 family protein [Marinifilaceae bacterium]